MVVIDFYDDGKVIKGILLGKYQRRHDEVCSYEKKFLWKTKTIHKHRILNTPLYVVLIPWKDQRKELREVDEKYIIDPQAFNADETWLTKDKFISEAYDGHVCMNLAPVRFEINDFVGYKFMYDDNSFIAKLCLHEFEECLTILYKNMPEVLDVDLGNKEE